MDKFDFFFIDLASTEIYNDDLTEDGASLIPDVEPNALLAPAGSRGVVVNVGHVAEQPQQAIYLVRFETGPDKSLGVPIGCMAEELTTLGAKT